MRPWPHSSIPRQCSLEPRGRTGFPGRSGAPICLPGPQEWEKPGRLASGLFATRSKTDLLGADLLQIVGKPGARRDHAS